MGDFIYLDHNCLRTYCGLASAAEADTHGTTLHRRLIWIVRSGGFEQMLTTLNVAGATWPSFSGLAKSTSDKRAS